MPTTKIYRAVLTSGTTGTVSWTECEGVTGPAQTLDTRNDSVDFEAREGTVNASGNVTVSVVGDGSSDCISAGSYYTTTTVAPTTTAPPITFNIAYTCVSGYGQITLTSFGGGNSGQYQTTIGAYQTETDAIFGTFADATAPVVYSNLPDGIKWVAVRDKFDTMNVTAKSKDVACSGGTTTLPPTTTTTTTTTAAPTTTTTTTTAAPTTITTTTTTTTTAAPTTTTTTTTTAAPTTTTTTTTTTTAAPTTTTTTTTTTAPATLQVYASDSGNQNIVLYASINGAPGFDIWNEAVDGALSSICGLIYTFSGTVVPGDTVTFSTNIACVMAGADSAVCPSATGANTQFTTATLTSGTNYVALGMNSTYSP